MTNILYFVTENHFEEDIRSAAAEIGVQVTLVRGHESLTDAEIAAMVEQWRELKPDIILARGKWKKRIAPKVDFCYVMTVRFSTEATLSILQQYRAENPHFFDTPKRALLCSAVPLFLDQDLLRDLFNLEAENLLLEELDPGEKLLRSNNPQPLLEKLSEYDLTIVGMSYYQFLKPHGANVYHKSAKEKSNILENFLVADLLVRAQKNLHEVNNVVQSILDNSFNAVLLLQEDGTISRCNGQIKRFFQKGPAEMVGMSVYELIPDFRPELLRPFFEENTGFYGELIRSEDRILVANGFPVMAEGKITGASITFEELRQVEQIEEKIKSELYTKGHVARYHFKDILGKSWQLLDAKDYAMEFAKNTANVLLYGESGTGKELFAQSIHNKSACKDGPFVAVNCGAFPSELLESELFGYAPGSFTGASKNGKKGLLEQANKGTIFLDEISEMEPRGQIRLLRVLEEKTVTRIGDDKVIPVDVRIIAASNKNLKKLVEEGKFREDLYYRLNVLMLKVPPLRERTGDIRLLAEHNLRLFGERNRKFLELEPEAVEVLEQYSWSGNVRQLRNFCERLVIISSKRVVDAEFVRRQLNESFFEEIPITAQPVPAAKPELPRPSSEGEELQLILDALNRSGGSRQTAAELLGISKTSLWRKMKKYNISEKF